MPTPTPTRANPYPDPAVVAGVQALERLSRALGALEARVRAQPVPEDDRMSQFYRSERGTLTKLGACDERLIGQAELLRAAIDGKDGTATIAALPTIEDGLTVIAATPRDRQAILFSIEQGHAGHAGVEPGTRSRTFPYRQVFGAGSPANLPPIHSTARGALENPASVCDTPGIRSNSTGSPARHSAPR